MAINSYPDNSGGEVNFPDQLIDPVSKFRVSNPENLIDTDFEYGLQPTKWETVELINNTPSFFSKSGDTTIDGISSIITNAGTREIIVKTELDHGLAVGIPINVTGTKSITADGAYIINSIPDPQTFTYLCKDNQTDTNSILDLYSSIITGEFFQGSQLRISDSDGIVTDAEGTSILTVTTNTTHGFGENTPFYFLNLNSTVAQEFQAANTASKSFDASNSATAQTFDGSNSLSSVSIDWSNSATFGGTPSTISGTDQAADKITVTHQAGENFNNLPLGTPLYYAVSATGGYFNTNPRGIVFLKTINQLGTLTSTFQVSLVPDGDAIDLTSNLTGTFQIANQAKTFAGNNINPLTQTVIDVEVGPTYNFDGGNQGYTGEVQGTPPNNTLTVLSYTTTAINADGASSVDYYVGAMVRYTSSGTAATGLTTNTTYFVTSFTNNSGGNYTFSVAALPGGSPISISGGSGTQTFSRIGISVDKDIVHIPNSNFSEGDMLEYSFLLDGRFEVVDEEQEKLFYFVDTAYDSHNYKLSEDVGFKPIVATGGTLLPEIQDQGRTWKVHQFTTTGTSSFVVSDPGKEGIVEYLIVAGGGAGGTRHAGGGGAGGVITGSTTVTEQSYSVVVGAGGTNPGSPGSSTTNVNGVAGSNSSAFGQTAIGGGHGSTYGNAGGNGGSGGGAGERTTNLSQANGGTGVAGQGFAGGRNNASGDYLGSGGGGGAGGVGQDAQVRANPSGGNGGPGIFSSITGTSAAYGGGGGGSTYGNAANNAPNFKNHGVGGVGGGGDGGTFDGVPGTANTGGGGGGGSSDGTLANGRGGNGGSGIVIVRYPITPPVELVPAIASGGTVTEVLDQGTVYRVHTFTSVGGSNFIVSDTGSWNQFEYLVVAGGGGGVYAGGGAGGVLTGKTTLTAQTYPITVGAGGVRTGNVANGTTNGGNSVFSSFTAIGGGRSGSSGTPTGGNGGSGGGRYAANFGGSAGLGTVGPPRQGFNGGTGGDGTSVYTSGGGGGGYTSVGQSTGQAPAAGGTGAVIFGHSVGGGGAGWNNNPVAYATAVNGGGSTQPALPNTGGGGSGAEPVPGAGGSGIVVIRYPIAIYQQPAEYISATGGEVSFTNVGSTRYRIHTFRNTGSNTFTVSNLGSAGATSLQYLIVAAGGGAPNDVAGAGGGGGVLEGTVTATATSYTINVGAGVDAGNGQNSTAFGLTAIGGGRGGNWSNNPGSSGGSGGGGSGSPSGVAGGGAGTAGQGFAGGAGGTGSSPYMSGAGGGAGAAAAGPSGIEAASGGIGKLSSISGLATYYGGGGGGGRGFDSDARAGGLGGLGGGGNGGGRNSTLYGAFGVGQAGVPNTGGGAGGNGSGSGARNQPGGSGIVIVRYKIGDV
jgi:hypothetical protein